MINQNLFDQIYMIVRQSIVIKYKKTFLGIAWSLISPLALMSTVAIIFSKVFKMDLVDFTVYMFVGMTVWNLFSNTVNQGSGSITGNEGLIKKIHIRKWIFPLSVSISSLIENLPMFIITYLMAYSLNIINIFGILKLIPIILMLLIFSLGLSMFLSVVCVYIRDIQYIMSIILQIWFYATPILYKTSMLGGAEEFVIKVNPIANYLILIRNCENTQTINLNGSYVLAIFYSAASIIIGILAMRLMGKNLVKHL